MASRRQSKSARARKRAKARVKTRAVWRDELSEQLADHRIDALVSERTAAKKARDFARADQIRSDLAAQGVILEDTKEGVRWKRQ